MAVRCPALWLFALFAWNAADAATFAVSKAISSNMVLQRDRSDSRIWGWGTPGATVTTTSTAFTQALTVTVGSDSIWRQSLPAKAAGGPYDIRITSSTGEAAIALTNVLFGDVYMCGGQSNMGFWAKDTINAATDLANLDYPNIRLMYVGLTTAPASNNDFSSTYFSWMAANTPVLTTYGFSGVCWFFGQRVYDGLGGTVPIGELPCCWSHLLSITPPRSCDDVVC